MRGKRPLSDKIDRLGVYLALVADSLILEVFFVVPLTKLIVDYLTRVPGSLIINEDDLPEIWPGLKSDVQEFNENPWITVDTTMSRFNVFFIA